MKQLIYAMALMLTAGLTACREEMLEGENAGEGVELTFSSGVEGLATEALADEVGNVHVLVYDETGNFVRREEYAGMDELEPVALDFGKYTFAFVTNIPEGLLEEGTMLEDVTLSADYAPDGGMCVESIFTGTDSVTVGEDKTSEAALRRVVGRVDVRLEGVSEGTRLERVSLLGSPGRVRFSGEAVSESDTATMAVPMTATADTGVYAGSVMAFPTVAETATLRFVMNESGEENTYDVVLRNRVEANKIHTVNVKYNGEVAPHDVTLTLEYEEEWGATIRDTATATGSLRMDYLTVKLVMEEGALTDLSQVRMGYLRGYNTDGSGEDVYVNFYLDSLPLMRGDTLVVRAEGDFYPGEYAFLSDNDGVVLGSLDGSTIYVLPEDVRTEVSMDGEMVIVLPAGVTVVESDLQAMKDLRDVLLEAGSGMASQWLTAGDDVSMWDEVRLDENGRVIRIGGSWYGIGEDYYQAPMAANGLMPMSDSMGMESPFQAIELPASFANLTALRCFTLGEQERWLSLTDVPAYFKDFEQLEELVVNTEGTTLPELPTSLRRLEVTGCNLREIPAHVGNLENLEIMAFNDGLYDEYGDGTSPSRIASVAVDFSGMTKLRELRIAASEDCAMPETLWQCGSLESLQIYGFSSFIVPTNHALRSLYDLRLDNESVRSSDLEALGSVALNRLILACSLFGEGETPDWIGEISTLRELSLRNCGIERIPASWDDLSELRFLELFHCPNLSGMLPDGMLKRFENGDPSLSVNDCPNFSPTGTYLNVSMSEIRDGGNGGTYTVEIESNGDWTVEVYDFPGMSVSPLAGSGNGTLTVTLEPNREEWNWMSGEIIIRMDDWNEERIMVEQEWSMEGSDSTYYYNRSVTH